MATTVERLERAYRVGVPIVAIDATDEIEVENKIGLHFTQREKASPVIVWDCIRGVTAPGYSRLGQLAIEQFLGNARPDDYAGSPRGLLADAVDKIPSRTVLIIRAAGQFVDDVQIWQAIINLRDEFKGDHRMLVLLGVATLPPSLQHNAIYISEPLPTAEELAGIVEEICTSADVPATAETLRESSRAALGMTAFAAENLAALAIDKEAGVNLGELWQSKARKINQTPGLRMVTNSATFEDIGGCAAIKEFLGLVLQGSDKPNAIVYLDEIEKCIGGSAGDTSGVAQDQLGQLLTWMQDEEATGVIFVGAPGAAKSAIAKSAGATYDVPTIQLDLGGAKGSLVGQSEQMIRDALKVVKAVSGGKTLWVATCNSVATLPPELKRRFRFGTWFFDLPDEEERSAIWDIYGKRAGLAIDKDELLANPWTGAEIETCCMLAKSLNVPATKAQQYIVPIAKQAADTLDALRKAADGRWLSASYPGTYQAAGRPKAAKRSRAME